VGSVLTERKPTLRLLALSESGSLDSNGGGIAMSFGLYATGFTILIVGLIYAAHLMNMPTQWIVVSAIVLLGFGIISGVKATRQKDPPT
jgi:hypothetical protein